MISGIILPDGNSGIVEEVEQVVFLTVSFNCVYVKANSKVLFQQCYRSDSQGNLLAPQCRPDTQFLSDHRCFFL